MELRFHIASSSLLSDEEKTLVLKKTCKEDQFGGGTDRRLTNGTISVEKQEKVIERFYSLLTSALTPRKKRKPTKPSLASKEERLETKRKLAEKEGEKEKSLNEPFAYY